MKNGSIIPKRNIYASSPTQVSNIQRQTKQTVEHVEHACRLVFFCLPSFQHTSTVASWNHSKPRSPVDCHNHSLSPILYIYIFQTIQNPSLSIYRNFRAFFLMIQNLGFLDSFSNVSRLLPPHPVPFDNHSWWRWQWQLPRVWRADNPRWNGKKKNDNEKLQ